MSPSRTDKTSASEKRGKCPRVVKKVRSPSGWVIPTESVVPSGPTGPLLSAVPKGFAQPAAELVGADIGGNVEINAKRFPGKCAVACLAANAKLVVVDDDLGARLGPRLGWSEDQVDIDVADNCKRTHLTHSG